MSRNWSKGDVDCAVEVLRASGTVSSAARALGVATSTLGDALRRHGYGTPASYLTSRPPAAAPVDPVTASRDATAKRDLKREHGELVERVKEGQARAEILEALCSGESTPIKWRERSSGLREGTPVVLASDWHIRETVDRDVMSGYNEFNAEICDRRVENFFVGIEWLIGMWRERYVIRDLILWAGGDLMTGFIHEELAQSNGAYPLEELLALKEYWRSGINRLLKDPQLERIIIPWNHGNHGRVTVKKHHKASHLNSYEWLAGVDLAREFAHEPRVEINVAVGDNTFQKAYDWTLHFTHGDTLRYGGGVGGLTIPLKRAIPRWDAVRRADYHHLGHFHTMLDLRYALVNGSLIGFSEYSRNGNFEPEAPVQAAYMLDARRGKTLVSPIWVDDEPAKGKKR